MAKNTVKPRILVYSLFAHSKTLRELFIGSAIFSAHLLSTERVSNKSPLPSPLAATQDISSPRKLERVSVELGVTFHGMGEGEDQSLDPRQYEAMTWQRE